MGWLQRLDRLIGQIIAAAQWLALPLILLLFLQWPLRDIVRGYSREANDLGQIIFALFVAVSVTAATRAGTHLAADTLAQRYSPRTRHRLKRDRHRGQRFAVGDLCRRFPARASSFPRCSAWKPSPIPATRVISSSKPPCGSWRC